LRHAADALAGTEDPDGALMVTWCEARSIIDDNWAALIRIARALQIQRRMDGATIDVVWDCCQREKRAIGKAGA
jgi:hypothetical protein